MNKYLSVLFLVVSFAELLVAKPFYLTVRRDYSPKENPQLEINYSFSSPIYIKILEPEDKKQFIATQIDIRRAWKKPGYELNPAHFMNLGFNDDQNSFDWIRRNLSYKIKKDLVGPLGGAHDTPLLAPNKLGPEKLIQIPKGFKLKTEIVLNPEPQDGKKDFDVPGFEEYYGGESSLLSTKMISLPKLATGFYLIQVIQGNTEGQVVLAVNDILSYMQRSNDTVIYRVFDRMAKPVLGAQISVRSLAGTWTNELKTDINGEARIDGVKEKDLLTVVSGVSKGIAIIDSEYFSTQVSFPDMYLFTDRPLYRNGDKVSFKGVLRSLVKGRSHLDPQKSSVKVEVYNISESKVSNSATVKFTEFGTFSGELKLNTDDSPGIYRIVAKLNKIEHASEVRVKDYVKPVYFLKLFNDQETAKKGDTLKFKVESERYAGGFPKITNALVTVYRTRVESSSQWIDDAGLGETGSTVTYGDDPNTGTRSLAPEIIVPAKEIKFDERGASEFQVEIPKELTGPKNLNYQYRVEVYTQDADDNIIYGNKSFFDLASEVVTQVRFNKIVAEAGKEAQLIVGSQSVSGMVMPDIEGEVKFLLKDKVVQTKKIRTNSKGVAKVDLPDDASLVGELRAEVTLRDKKKNPSTQFAEIILVGKVAGAAVVNFDEVRLLTNQTEVINNEVVKIFMALPDKWGAAGTNSGHIFLTLAGDKIFKTQPLLISGRSFWLSEKILPEYGNQLYFVISYVHPERGWIEKRASFRIRDPDKKLKVQWLAKDEKLVPGSQQKIKLRIVNSASQPVKAEVAIAVVDQAVLDIQSEFRPSLEEFFYPMTRLNLMSFYSSHFQGYGYGETIAQMFKPNHVLAANKNQSQPMEIKDTAYWKANLVTNEKGEIEFKFNLPGNQTIWRVTAVVVDKEGRFGESTTKFKSQLPLSLLVGYPPFLRSTDKSRIRVNITGTEITQELNVKYSAISNNKNILNFADKNEFSILLKPKQQSSENLNITIAEVNNPNVVAFAGHLEFGKSNLDFKDTIRILPKSTLVNDFYFPESNSFKVSFEKGEKAQGIELKVFNDFTSIMFSNLEWMVQYPYGCVEQTLSTTVSNQVISDILHGVVGKGINLNPLQKTTLKKATDNAVLGFKRLAKYQAKTGGFGWFPDSDGPDLNMTLLVMLNMALTERDVNFNLYEYRPTYDWLTTKDILPGSPQGIAFSFIESVFIKKYIVQREEKDLKTILRTQNDYVLKNGTLFEKALQLMTLANHSFSEKEFSNDFKSLIESNRKSLEQMKDSQAPIQYGNFAPQSQNGWAAYPGRAVSSIALAYRSLIEAESVVNKPVHKKNKKSAVHEVKITYINDKIHALVKKNVLSNFNGYYFGSTFDNGIILTSLKEIIEKDMQLTVAKKDVLKKLEVTINDKAVSTEDLLVSNNLTGYTLVIKDLKSITDQAKVSVNTVIEGQMVRARVSKLSSIGSIQSKASGWQIGRSYYKLNDKGDKKEIQMNEKLRVGDLVYCEIKFKPLSGRNFWQSRYYVVTTDTPAGFQTIQEDQIYQGSPYNLPLLSATKTREILNHQTRWFFDFSRGWMDNGTQVGIVYRVQYPGEFNSGIAKIEDFYDETKASYSSSGVFTIDSN